MKAATKLLRLDETLKAQIEKGAEALDLNSTQFIRRACRQLLSENFTDRQLARMAKPKRRAS